MISEVILMSDPVIRAFVDTSFLIRLLNEEDSLHGQAKDYFRYILDQSGIIFCSTIAIAEYCVKGTIEELPLELMQVVPFNAIHAVKSGECAAICFAARVDVTERVVIPNDCKLLAQAQVEEIQYFLTTDGNSRRLYDELLRTSKVTYKFVDIRTPYDQIFGVLPFSE